MSTENRQDFNYRLLRNRRGANKGKETSTWVTSVPDEAIPRKYSLRFHITALGFEEARRSALEASFHINEHFSVPDEYMEIVYNGGGEIGNNSAASEKSDGLHRDGTASGDPAEKSNCHLSNCNSAGTATHPVDDYNGSRGAKEGTSAAEIVISIPPVVFGGRPTSILLGVNCELARQMADYGIGNINIDVYQRDSFIRLPNSMNSATDRFAIRLTGKELLYLDGGRIAELSKQPRPDDLMTIPKEVPEAEEWFAEVHADFEKKQRRQNELQKSVQQQGWEIQPCVRRLLWLDADKSTILEACRLISGTYSFLGSNEAEIRYHVQRLARRNAIEGLKEHEKLRAIVTFGVENPMLADCRHFLLTRFCPVGGCYVTELMRDYQRPSLFEGI